LKVMPTEWRRCRRRGRGSSNVWSGSGTFISLETVINNKSTPKHLESAELGDRVKVECVVIESGQITVGMVTHGPDDPMCYPTVEAVQKYKLQGDTLVRISGGDGQSSIPSLK